MSDFNENEQKPTEELQEETHDLPFEEGETVIIQKDKNAFPKELVDYIEIFVFALCFVILLFSFAFRLCTVDGSSMENTLYEGESLLVSDLFYTPQSGDVIVFHQTGTLNEPVVKRVIATEGETVRLEYASDHMTVTITHTNGDVSVLEEPYVKYDGYPLYVQPSTVTVPEGKLFVMGDNRNESKDSRHPDIGLVDERRVLGKVLLRFTPISRFGAVD